MATFLLGPKLESGLGARQLRRRGKDRPPWRLQERYRFTWRQLAGELWIIFLETGSGRKVQTMAALWAFDGNQGGYRYSYRWYKRHAFAEGFAVYFPVRLVAETPHWADYPSGFPNQL